MTIDDFVARHWVLDGKFARPAKSLDEVCRLIGDATARRVAEDFVEAPGGTVVHVSTVFLCVDHRFRRGDPVLFETMVFGGPLDGTQDRYSYWDEAEAGHRAMVDRVREALGLPTGDSVEAKR